MDKFKNKYRIDTFRAQWWDYAWNGAYFITICTKNREHYFGKIENQEIKLNEIGQLAEKYWSEIPQHFPYIQLANFVIMPDHMHGILIIDNHHDINEEARLIAPPHFHHLPDSLQKEQNEKPIGGATGIHNPMLHDNISRIIRWYKGRCTFEMRKVNQKFSWQSLFYDHIIRNSESFERIQNYIKENPKKWGKDKLR